LSKSKLAISISIRSKAMGIPIALFFILSELNPFDFLMLAISLKNQGLAKNFANPLQIGALGRLSFAALRSSA